MGRRDGQVPEAQKPYGGAWTGPQFVLTHEAPGTSEDPTIRFLSGDIRAAVAEALQAAQGKNVVVIGAKVAQSCIDEGLIAEILVHLAPVRLGDGVRLFARPGSAPINLERTNVGQSGQLTDLRFRVAASSQHVSFPRFDGRVGCGDRDDGLVGSVVPAGR